jgi:cyclopropane fatty-acyl-phospholipid synthase-like methyltransferase
VKGLKTRFFFNRKFDAIISWGLLFLLPEKIQEVVIQKAANALQPGGKLLFTSTGKKQEWKDAMTEQDSISLGAQKYRDLIKSAGLSLIEEFEDEGENYYFNAIKS